MATISEILTRISEAETALHALMTGQAVVEVWRDGRRVRYEQRNSDQLRDYIAALRSDLVDAQYAEGITVTRRRRAIGLAWNN